jgi:hypothetical protein
VTIQGTLGLHLHHGVEAKREGGDAYGVCAASFGPTNSVAIMSFPSGFDARWRKGRAIPCEAPRGVLEKKSAHGCVVLLEHLRSVIERGKRGSEELEALYTPRPRQ